jgi:polyferredoxin
MGIRHHNSKLSRSIIDLTIFMKPFFAIANIAALRLTTQSLFAFFCLAIGMQYYQFYRWATQASEHFVQRPPAVEAFLPIGALVSLKRLILSGEYDPIHPAGLTIFLAALFLGLFLRKGFCGWICPIGLASNLAERAGKKLHILAPLPRRLDLPLSFLKYLLLGAFSWLILWNMNLQDLTAFHLSSYNLIADAKMLHFFLHPSLTAASIMLALTAASFIVKNLWCRYLCPYGALLGLLAFLSPFQIRRDSHLCINCKKCETVCPVAIGITAKETVRAAACIGCLECVAVCPQKDCLQLSLPGKNSAPPLLLPGLVIASFLLFWLIARLTGHWQTQIPAEIFQHYYQQAQFIGHP